jgi:hypothetical protein
MLYLYDVCNDYTLELREYSFTSEEREELNTVDCPLGTFFYYDTEEGPIYFASNHNWLNGDNFELVWEQVLTDGDFNDD